jgi:isopentenyl phosphate kinase
MNDLTVLKIGGSIITEKSSPVPKARNDEITRIAKEIAFGHSNLVIVHGAGSFGHPLALKYKLTEQFHARGVIETHRSVKELNFIIVDALVSAGVQAVPVHPFNSFMLENGRIKEMFIDPIQEMLDRQLVPVLHGDVVMDKTRGAAVLSGDQIVPYIAGKLGADNIGIGSNTNGVLDADGQTIPVITPASFNKIRSLIGGSSHTDVTGGMLGKVQELVDLADLTKIESRIFNAASAGSIQEFMKGAAIGTLIQKVK